MQTIPSPEDSILHLPSPSKRQEPATVPRPKQQAPVERSQPPPEPQRANAQSNGDTIMPVPLGASGGTQTNGVNENRGTAPIEPEASLSPKPPAAEVSTIGIDRPWPY